MDLQKAIDRVAEILNSSDIKEIRIKNDNSSIFMTKNAAVTNIASMPAAVSVDTISNKPTEAQDNKKEKFVGEEIKSPMVGTFYNSPSPGTMPYISKEGQEVKKGDTLCIIEAMKIMNKIEAERSGEITRILVADGESVQFDQPLFIIK